VNHYYHADGLGSTRLLTDESGNPTDTYDYDAFGNLLDQTGSTPNVYLFAGEQSDDALGLYYLRARYMDPRLGRFISSDPFPGSVYNPASLHKYTYAHNNPVNFTDPSGQFTLFSTSISLSCQSILAKDIIFLAWGATKVKELKGKLDEYLSIILGLPLNKKATREQLIMVFKPEIKTSPSIGFSPDGGVSFGSSTDISLVSGLGEGAVAKAYEINTELIGDNLGKTMAFIYRYPVGCWMAELPEVDGIPGKYISPGFNKFVQGAYSLMLVNKVASGKIGPAMKIIGIWLNYIDYIALMENTVMDVATGVLPESRGVSGGSH
jgi:RHS repeat-associated protein